MKTLQSLLLTAGLALVSLQVTATSHDLTDGEVRKVDKDAKKVTIWERGGAERDRGRKLFDGTYDVTNSSLALRGKVEDRQDESTTIWKRR